VARGAKRATALGSAAGHSVTMSGRGAGFISDSLPATMPSMCCFKTAAWLPPTQESALRMSAKWTLSASLSCTVLVGDT
jgi:hypothetical protein